MSQLLKLSDSMDKLGSRCGVVEMSGPHDETPGLGLYPDFIFGKPKEFMLAELLESMLPTRVELDGKGGFAFCREKVGKNEPGEDEPFRYVVLPGVELGGNVIIQRTVVLEPVRAIIVRSSVEPGSFDLELIPPNEGDSTDGLIGHKSALEYCLSALATHVGDKINERPEELKSGPFRRLKPTD